MPLRKNTLLKAVLFIGVLFVHNGAFGHSPPGNLVLSSENSTRRATSPSEVIFIDPSVPELQKVVAHLPQKSEVVILGLLEDGISQISEHLAKKRDLSAIHIISHGGPGHFDLNGKQIDGDFLRDHGDPISAWGRSLAEGGDILLYACNLAATDEGKAFVEKFSDLSDADVAASIDNTGSDICGGDWELEYGIGMIGTTEFVMDNSYEYILAELTVRNDNDTGADSLRYQISVANSGDTIVFDDNYTISLASSITIDDKNLIIDGGNESIEILNGSTFIPFYITGISALTFNSVALEDDISAGAVIQDDSSGLLTLSDVHLKGNVNANGGSGGVTVTGTLTLTGNVTIDTDGSTDADINITGTVEGETSNTQDLTLNSGTGGAISVTGAIGGGTSLKHLTVTNSNGATFTGDVTTGTQITLSNTTAGADITFSGTLTTGTLSTMAVGYNVDLFGDGTSITNLVEFLNTGNVALGNNSADTLDFDGGVETTGNVTNPSTTTLNGTITTSNDPVALGTTTVAAGSGTGISTVNPAGGALTFGAVTINSGAKLKAGDTENAGTISFNSTVDGPGDLEIKTTGSVTLSANIGTTSLGVLTLTEGNLAAGGNYITAGTITVNGGIFGLEQSPSGVWDVENVTIASGAEMNAPSGTDSAFKVSGIWDNAGTFNHKDGTVTLDDTSSQTIIGSTTFYNLTKNVTSAATLTFPSATTTTVVNTLNLSGENGQLLSLRSSTSGTQWSIDLSADPWVPPTLTYLDVQDSNNVSGTTIDTVGKNIFDSGGNTNWTFVAPTVTTQAVSEEGTTSATGNGTIDSLGSNNPTAHGVCWNTSGTPTISDNVKDNGAASATGAFTAEMTGLSGGTTYHVRAFATNSVGTSYGSDTDFTTSAATAPTVTTTAASSITTTTAASGGNVTADGGASVTARGVCWSTSANPTINDSKTSDGTGTGTFTSSITGLTPNTTYHVRAYATNSAGTAYGAGQTFTTAAPAGTYYVNINTGSNSNDGSINHPWKTLHHAFTQINGGPAGTYVLYVALGTYSVGQGEGDTQLILTQSQVTIKGQDGSGPIIDGTNAQTWSRGIDITGSNVDLVNLYVTGFADTDEEGIRISGGSDNEIRYCEVYENNWGIWVNEAENAAIRNCEIYGNSTHGIDIVRSTDVQVVRNRIHGNPQYGIRVASSSEISRNILYDNDHGIFVDAVNGNTVSPTITNNVIYEDTSNAMSYGIFTRSTTASTVNPKIYHNTIDGGKLNGISMEKDADSASSPIIQYNNITGFGQFGIENTGASPTIEYNDLWDNTAGNYSGGAVSSTNKNVNPRYVDATNNEYSLQSDSECINAIPSGDPVTLDYPGFIRPRPNETAKDMGAYEYVAKETNSYNLPGGSGIATDYRIFTVPLNLQTGLHMLMEMEEVLGNYDPVRWRAFMYNGTSYTEFNDHQFSSQEIVPGMGFWIITTYTDTVPFDGTPAPDGVDYVMELSPGWHLIGLPWTSTRIFLSSIKVTDGVNTYAVSSPSNDLTQRRLWDYTGADGYVARTAAGFRLQDNKGYFFKVNDKPIRMIIPNAANLAQEGPTTDAVLNRATMEGADEPPPPPPGQEPIPDIKVNGQDGPVSVKPEEMVSVSVALDPGVWQGQNADWWVAARTPFDPPLDWYTYVYPEGWRYGFHTCAQTPLYELSPYTVLNTTLPPGDYVFYFAVDGNMDGVVDATWLDFVYVTVK